MTNEVSGAYNEILSKLGLSEPDCAKFARFMRQYMTASSFDDRITELIQLLGLENDQRIDKYVSAAERFQKNWWLKNALFLGIRVGKINEKLTFRVSSRLKTV